MDKSLFEYKRFIDGLVQLAPSVEARRIRAGLWHSEPPPEQEKYNILLRSLSEEERELFAQLVERARTGGMHDVLVLLTDREYHVLHEETELAHEPFGTESYFDFVARCAGDEWPDEG